MKIALGLPRLQKQVHQHPKLFPIHLHMTTRTLEVQGRSKELGLFLKASSEKKQLQDPGMKVVSMIIVIFVLTLVIKLWSVDSTEEEVVEGPMTQLDDGHVIELDMLLPHVTY